MKTGINVMTTEVSARRKLHTIRNFGSQSRTRTCNLAINSRLLCQLSYLGMHVRQRNSSTGLCGPGLGYCRSNHS